MDSIVANPLFALRADSHVSSASVAAQEMLLDDLPLGRRARVVALREESSFLYLLRLGLVVGAEVELVRKMSRGHIKIFRVDSGELALRSDSARGIRVRLEPR